jgi:hypothetical protein
MSQGHGTEHANNRSLTDPKKRLYQKSLDFEEAIKAGKHLRHL